MQVLVNGELRALSARTVAELVSSLALDARQVAIEHNGAIVPRSAYASTALSANDRIELVRFIGGG